MSILNKLTEDQIAAFEDCKTKEELLEVAAKLGITPTEEDIAEAMAMIKTANLESGEINDDDLDAVAGGTDLNKEGYVKVSKNDECLCGEYESSPTPIHSHTKDGRHCGTCKHCRQVRSADVCTKMKF